MSPVRDGSWDGKRMKPVIWEVDRVAGWRRPPASPGRSSPLLQGVSPGSRVRHRPRPGSRIASTAHCPRSRAYRTRSKLSAPLGQAPRLPNVRAYRVPPRVKPRDPVARYWRVSCFQMAARRFMRARVRKSPAADDEVVGSRGARVIVLFPRPAVAPPRPWWRRALRWLRYGTSGIWRARPGQVEPRAARVRERPSRRLRTRVG